jgi:hypothetical protein
MQTAIIIFMNLAVMLILAGVAYWLEWSGPAFTAGVLVGGIATALYLRVKMGYWP